MTDTTTFPNPDTGKGAKEEAEKESGVELTQTLQRVQADFENYRKRTQNEFTHHYARGKAAAFKEILSFMDTLDAAVTQVKDAHRADLERLRAQLLQLLSQNGVRSISTKGKPFDPFTSECIQQGNDPAQGDDVVLEEFLPGYMFNDDVLRPAKVKVNKIADIHTHQETKGGNHHE
ncbi:MAG: nucleotide exchange factor GrpE [archaeon]